MKKYILLVTIAVSLMFSVNVSFAQVCGDRICDGGETVSSCASDCAFCTSSFFNSSACSAGGCTLFVTGTNNQSYCLGGAGCGDNVCDKNAGEDSISCVADCPPVICGDGQCVRGESCSADCQNETVFCTDGVDNDQDIWVDCRDPDCHPSELVCQPVAYCGDGICSSTETAYGSPPENSTNCLADCARETNCVDSSDNDADTLTDCQDTDCFGRDCFPGSVCYQASCTSVGQCGSAPADIDGDGYRVWGSGFGDPVCDSIRDTQEGNPCIPDPNSFACQFCGNSVCDSWETAEVCAECRICGNGVCDLGETPSTCPSDCLCGNGIVEQGEFCDSSPFPNFNPPCGNTNPSGLQDFCNGDCNACVTNCGNQACESNLGENSNTCSIDCVGSFCGNGIVEQGEICDPPGSTGTGCGFFNGIALICNPGCQTCANSCGNGFCDSQVGENNNNCPQDCTTPCQSGGVCVPMGSDSQCCSGRATGPAMQCPSGQNACLVVGCSQIESPESSCTDGVDNDCDALTDCDDPNNCGSDAACVVPVNPEICNDGIDNDGDGLTDLNDPNCQTQAIADSFGGNQLDPTKWFSFSQPTINISVLNGFLQVIGTMSGGGDPGYFVVSTAQCGGDMTFEIDHKLGLETPLVSIIGFLDFGSGGGPSSGVVYFVSSGDLGGGTNVLAVTFTNTGGFNVIPVFGVLTNDTQFHHYKVKISGSVANFTIDGTASVTMPVPTMVNPQPVLLTASFDPFTGFKSVANFYDNANIVCTGSEPSCTTGQQVPCSTLCGNGTKTCDQNGIFGPCSAPQPTVQTQTIASNVQVFNSVGDSAINLNEGKNIETGGVATSSDANVWHIDLGALGVGLDVGSLWANNAVDLFAGFFGFTGDHAGKNISFAQKFLGNSIVTKNCTTATDSDFYETFSGDGPPPGLLIFVDPTPFSVCARDMNNPDNRLELLIKSADRNQATFDVSTTQLVCPSLCTDPDNDGLKNEGGDCGQVDQCPNVAGPASKNGCPVADSNFVELHVIDKEKTGKCPGGAGSCKSPISGAEVRVFNRNDPAFQSIYGTKNPSGTTYNQVFENGIGLISSCTTDNSGNCIAGETSTGDYLVIVRYIDSGTGKVIYSGKPKSPSDFVNGTAFKDFQIMKVFKKDGTIEFKNGGKTVITGSQLEIIYPQSTIWEDNQELYPFVFTSDSNWTVDVCLQMPQGYQIAGSSCEQAFVSSGESKVIMFTAKEIGSPEPNANFDLTAKDPKGKQTKISKQVDGVRGKHPNVGFSSNFKKVVNGEKKANEIASKGVETTKQVKKSLATGQKKPTEKQPTKSTQTTTQGKKGQGSGLSVSINPIGTSPQLLFLALLVFIGVGYQLWEEKGRRRK